MIAAAERAKVTLMVAYNKRYDPAYLRLQEQARDCATCAWCVSPRGIAVSALRGALSHHRSRRRHDETARIAAAIGDADPLSRRAYHLVLLDSWCTSSTRSAACWRTGPAGIRRYSRTRPDRHLLLWRHAVIVTWVDLPGMARYQMEFAFCADRRLTLSFPSPFLRSAPTVLASTAEARRTSAPCRTEKSRLRQLQAGICISMTALPPGVRR
jgi:hypothetical protein